MREETVTKGILHWLTENDWLIICYDFPQSGTGVLLHLNNTNRTDKNKGGIIPDIIAVKNDIALFFENKDRFYEPDFNKLSEIKTQLNYSEALNDLLSGFEIENIYYGIGLPTIKKEIKKSELHLDKIDFLISIDENNKVIVHFEKNNIFSNT